MNQAAREEFYRTPELFETREWDIVNLAIRSSVEIMNLRETNPRHAGYLLEKAQNRRFIEDIERMLRLDSSKGN